MSEKTTKTLPQSHWDNIWDVDAVPAAADITSVDINHFMTRRFGRYFDQNLPPAQPNARLALLEAGCGGSAWLPAFARQYGLEITGIDYSEQGCSLSRAILAKAGVQGTIIHADLFTLPINLQKRFDIVFSNGLVEHFEPAESIITQLVQLLRPGGRIISIIPNMRGLQGLLQKWIDRPLYNAHVAHTPASLAACHQNCGLKVLDASYLGTLSLGTINAEVWSGTWKYRLFRELAYRCSIAVWRLEEAGMREKQSLTFSPFVACVAQKNHEEICK
ncbi:class I SAM-dependent methyltransferase [Paucidesulfovibrio longus]|uniref:class I SAM-dependent methyltransferase n=1 Tax=Paucidesulfovibrio longus TaxID=889 RepID=UPI0003B405BC|nr:class I SAM-dependent methyltransferase [Paucidesulfovibrio longus]